MRNGSDRGFGTFMATTLCEDSPGVPATHDAEYTVTSLPTLTGTGLRANSLGLIVCTAIEHMTSACPEKRGRRETKPVTTGTYRKKWWRNPRGPRSGVAHAEDCNHNRVGDEMVNRMSEARRHLLSRW
jgi:hypothetical protein